MTNLLTGSALNQSCDHRLSRSHSSLTAVTQRHCLNTGVCADPSQTNSKVQIQLYSPIIKILSIGRQYNRKLTFGRYSCRTWLCLSAGLTLDSRKRFHCSLWALTKHSVFNSALIPEILRTCNSMSTLESERMIVSLIDQPSERSRLSLPLIQSILESSGVLIFKRFLRQLKAKDAFFGNEMLSRVLLLSKYQSMKKILTIYYSDENNWINFLIKSSLCISWHKSQIPSLRSNFDKFDEEPLSLVNFALVKHREIFLNCLLLEHISW